MTLEEYHKTMNVTYARIAKLCGVTGAMISQIARQVAKPSFELALEIERVTDGHVGRENWFPPRPAEITITIGATSL